MPETTLPSDRDALRDLALEAGTVLGDDLSGALAVAGKAGTEFVTEADRRSEELVLSGLARLFPGEPVVAEESGSHPGHGDRTWYVDPLDGTTNYAHGYPFYCVSIGAQDAQGLALAAVCAPALGECYLAARGYGAQLMSLRTGKVRDLPVRQGVPLDAALLATGFPYVRDELVSRNTDLVRALLQAPCHGVRRAGSAALDLCHVAAGRLDGYWEFRLRPWDCAAGTLVARECGVTVTRVSGESEELPHADILAAPGELHAAMLTVIGGRSDPCG
ncbi:inositol monophosphatase [bacterium]|nr:inositol monophosphatase [bacterium]